MRWYRGGSPIQTQERLIVQCAEEGKEDVYGFVSVVRERPATATGLGGRAIGLGHRVYGERGERDKETGNYLEEPERFTIDDSPEFV